MPSASIVGLIVGIAGTAVSTAYSVKASKTQEDISDYQARLAREQAAAEEAAARRKAQQELGRERAVLGKLGIVPTKGTPLEQLAYNAGEAERSAVLARSGLLQEASLYDIQARTISSQRGLLASANVLSGLASASSSVSPLLSTSTKSKSRDPSTYGTNW